MQMVGSNFADFNTLLVFSFCFELKGYFVSIPKKGTWFEKRLISEHAKLNSPTFSSPFLFSKVDNFCNFLFAFLDE